MKKTLSIFLALCLMLSCLPVAALLPTALPKAHAEETSVKALQFVQNGEVEIADRQNSADMIMTVRATGSVLLKSAIYVISRMVSIQNAARISMLIAI